MKNRLDTYSRLALISACFFLTVLSIAGAKTLYLIADHHADPTPLNAYHILANPPPCVEYQGTYNVVFSGTGASGLAMYNDPDGNHLYDDAQIFITYESSNEIEIVNALSFDYEATIVASGATDLAGITVSQKNRLVYAVDRGTRNLFIYDADTFAPQGDLPIELLGMDTDYAWDIALDDELDIIVVSDGDSTVHVYSTLQSGDQWTEDPSSPFVTDSLIAVGLGYDEESKILYSGGAFMGDGRLAKYELLTGNHDYIDDANAMGLAVDIDTGLLYITTGHDPDELRCYDPDLNLICTYPDPEAQILNPAGILIPTVEVDISPPDPGPRIGLNSAMFGFSSYVGGSNPDDQILSIFNSGDDTLNWNVNGVDLCPWLDADPMTGQSTGEIDEVTLSVDASGMSAGEYTFQFEVTDPSATNDPQTVHVILYIGNNSLNVPSQYGTIQAAIDAAADHDWVIVADGTYTGTGNKNLDFNGKPITLINDNGPQHCVIDCEGDGRGFHFHNRETLMSIVNGFTVTNGNESSVGGAVYCENSSRPTLVDCIFSSNTAVDYGGGMFNDTGSRPTLISCTFSNNSASGGLYTYGGGMCNDSSYPVLTDCTFSENSTGLHGGGMANVFNSRATLTDCSFINNLADESGAGIYNYFGDTMLNHCTISVNSTGVHGGGIYNDSGDLTLSDCTFSLNWAGGGLSGGESGGGIYNDSGDLVLVDCTFSANSAYGDGGGFYNGSGNPTLNNCTFFENSVSDGLFGYDHGGGIYNDSGDPTLNNCTFSANWAENRGGGMFSYSGNPTLNNCILWDNGDSTGWNGESGQIYVSGGSPVFNHCCVEGWTGGLGGTNNIGGGPDDDPHFVDATNNDYHLTWDSSCLNTGDNSVVTQSTDFEGDPRVAEDTVDRGADEFYYHLYHRGDVVPGESISICVVGEPTDPVLLGMGSGIQNPPQSTPYGDLYLPLPLAGQWNLSTVPATGVLIFPATVPSSAISGEQYPFQALVGPLGNPDSLLTNLMVLTVETAPSGYLYDDGSSESALGLGGGGDICWIHCFNSSEGGMPIADVQATFGCVPYGGSPPNGTAFQVHVWDDPDNDRNPDDAVLVASGSGSISGGDTDFFNVVPLIPQPTLTGYFFVGVVVTHVSGEYPASLDYDSSYNPNDAWMVGTTSSGTFNPNNLLDPNHNFSLEEMGSMGFPYHFLLRAGL